MHIQFRTEVNTEPLVFPLTHYDKLMLMGSCFTVHIGARLEAAGFLTDVNPFGVLYNPLSVAAGMRELMLAKVYHGDDLIEHNGLYASFSHHSRFSSSSREQSLQQINRQIEQSHLFLKQASALIVTFGTAFVYRLTANGQVVSNCHKLPPSYFDRKRLTVEEIVDEWSVLLKDLYALNPKLRVLFTVSPIRHWKDGAHGNQLSKAVLLLAVEELERLASDKSYPQVKYFPSYELVLDDLRDYRYYTEDMLHPSSVAVDYIWEKLRGFCFDPTTRQQANEYHKLHQILQHRPFNPDSDAYIALRNDTLMRIDAFRKKYTRRNE